MSAGLISPDLMDILTTPEPDAAVARKTVKRITGARDLTANEYFDRLREEKRRKKEAEEEKKKKKEERKRIREENERKKKEK